MKDPELVIQYFPDSDTLRLGAGVTPAEGENDSEVADGRMEPR